MFEVDDLTKVYPGGRGIQGLNLTVHSGEVVSLPRAERCREDDSAASDGRLGHQPTAGKQLERRLRRRSAQSVEAAHGPDDRRAGPLWLFHRKRLSKAVF